MALIDRAIVSRLLAEREATIDDNGLVYVPRGEAEPQDAVAYFRRYRIAMRRLSRREEAASGGADLAALTVEYAVIVSEARMKPPDGNIHAADTHIQQIVTAMTQTALVDAATGHRIHLDASEEDEMPAPDEQRGIVVYKVVVRGMVERVTGQTMVVFPAEEEEP
jgi:hypothetical protein